MKIGSEVFHFMKVKETQPVHLLSQDSSLSSQLNLLGAVTHKLNLKLELEASKAEAIRQRSQEAEKERLSRKTVELDSSTKINGNVGQKRLIRRTNVLSNTTNNSVKSIDNFPLRTRILQILAIEPISLESLIKKLSLTNTQDLKSIIPNLCGHNFNPKSLVLRPELYGEVKVADWPFYSLRERSQVSRTISNYLSSSTPINSISTLTPTSPETPETPSPKKQTFSSNFPSTAKTSSVPSSAKKGSSAKDRLSAIMKKRR